MIPLVGDVKELKYVKKTVVETADAEIAASGIALKYEVGTMIEIPRACLTADEIAANADFFCFGTNDLTQMTFGFSRDDSGKFLNAYYDAKIFENDPFAKLDQEGVGKLMKMAIDLGKPVNPKLHIGICGEHGGDPSSVEFCHKIGLDYVSCSPFRVPVARLAAAQAAITQRKGSGYNEYFSGAHLVLHESFVTFRPSQNAGRAFSLENAAPLIGCILRKLAHTRSNKLRMHPLCSHFQRSNGECPAYLKMVVCTNVTLKVRTSVRKK